MESDTEERDAPPSDRATDLSPVTSRRFAHGCVPWSKREATEKIRDYAKDPRLDLHFKKHAREQLAERGILTGDVFYVLKMGFVLAEPRPSTDPCLFKYRMESKSPNSNGRTVGVVVIPNATRPSMKVLTVMWVDE